jgi:NDP-sugar pyrophosphorylase family protein
MRYIIMCGGSYLKWKTPRQLLPVDGEPIVARTIRLLREHGVTDIAISSGNDVFGQFGVPVLKHNNSYEANGHDNISGIWCDAFFPTDDPVCYLFGDVIFSPDAIKTIVETRTEDIQFFASAPPFAPEYPKQWAEPFALKVVNTGRLKKAIRAVKQYDAQRRFRRKPIMWELWSVITGGDLNSIDYHSYVAINDYTCDIDDPEEVP